MKSKQIARPSKLLIQAGLPRVAAMLNHSGTMEAAVDQTLMKGYF